MRMIKSGTYSGKPCYALAVKGTVVTYWRTPNKLSCKKELRKVTGRRAARQRRLTREYIEYFHNLDYHYGYTA
jgi:hypothetical protein